MSSIPSLDRIKIFADGASLPSMLESARDPRISGFTTNPTLMRKAGISDYRAFAKEVLASIKDRPISFEVFADEFAEMRRQAQDIATWGDNVYVKIPITNTRREPATALIRELASSGVKLNVTAICTLDQVRDTAQALKGGAPSVVSVFAGRIADTGRDPIPLMKEALGIVPRRRQAHRAAVGQPARAAEHRPGGGGRLRHHHGDARSAEEAGAGRQGPGRLQPGHRADVLSRRPGGRVQAVSGAGDFVRGYLDETVTAVRGLDAAAIDAMAVGLARVREQGGRLFILGVGGSAGHASHAVNDFRKICGFEAYSPTDNVSELTARVNDEGWDTSFSEWLKVSRLSQARRRAGVFGRRRQPREERLAQPGARAGAGGGAGRRRVRHRRQGRRRHEAPPPRRASSSRRSPPDRITPHTEGLCAVVWHLLVSHPALKRAATKWESTK